MEHMPTHPYYLILVVYKNSLKTPSLSHPCGVQELIEYEDNSSHCSRVLCCCFLFVSVDETLKIKTHTLIQTNTQILGLRHIHTDINTHTHTHAHPQREIQRDIFLQIAHQNAFVTGKSWEKVIHFILPRRYAES